MSVLSVAQREVVRDIEEICSRDLDSRTLRARVGAALARAVPHDAFCFGAMDPWTLLIADGYTDGIPLHETVKAAHNEYLVPDVNKFSSLARSRDAVGILSRAVGADLRISHRLRSVMPTIDARFEIRAALLADGQCWGGLAMFRAGGSEDFTAADADVLRSVSPTVAAALRRAAHRPAAGVGITPDPGGPGVILLGADSDILSINEAAHRWLAELDPPDAGRRPTLPTSIEVVAAAARARSRAVRPSGSPGREPQAHVRVRTRAGRWVTLHGSTMNDSTAPGTSAVDAPENDKCVSVVIEAAPASDIAQMLVLAYGLTRRERQILQRVMSGLTSADIARHLYISLNTVQDHLKSIFAKVGVRSRGQLVARVLGEHYLPPL